MKRLGRASKRAAVLARHPMFRQGARDTVAVALGLAAWAMVTGVAMAKTGMGIPLSLLMSFLVFAGSSQLAVLPLIVADSPIWMVWAIVGCVNLRFLVYGYQYRPYFGHLPRRRRMALSFFMGDTVFALFVRRFPKPRPEPGQVAYFLGTGAVNYGAWQVFVVIGLIAGQGIPPEWGLGFAGTLALLALACGQLRTPSTWIAAVVAAYAAVAAYNVPLRLNILIAVAAAVAVGALARQIGPKES